MLSEKLLSKIKFVLCIAVLAVAGFLLIKYLTVYPSVDRSEAPTSEEVPVSEEAPEPEEEAFKDEFIPAQKNLTHYRDETFDIVPSSVDGKMKYVMKPNTAVMARRMQHAAAVPDHIYDELKNIKDNSDLKKKYNLIMKELKKMERKRKKFNKGRFSNSTYSNPRNVPDRVTIMGPRPSTPKQLTNFSR